MRWPSLRFMLLLVLSHSGGAEVIRAEESPAIRPAVSTILFGSCLVPERSHSILDAIVADRPDLFVFTGDNIYADTVNPQTMSRHYDALASSSRFQALISETPVVAIWDDHDYGMNDAGEEYPMKEESERQFERFWGLGSGAAATRPGVYQSYLFGPPDKRVQLILLDTRWFRSALKRGRSGDFTGPYAANDDPNATILGERQWRWFERELELPARLRIIVSSIQALSPAHGWESWANFPLERERLLQTIAQRNGGGTVIVSGDRHFAEISSVVTETTRRVESTRPYGVDRLFELTSSGLNRRFPADVPNANEFRTGGYYLDYNYGTLRIDWNSLDPRLMLAISDSDGTTVLEEEFRLSEIGGL